MFRAWPLQLAAGVCALIATCAVPVHAQPNLKRWLFAEGSTNADFGFEQEILIANPNGSVANVTLRFLPQDGTPPIVGTLQVEPYSRQGVNARQFVGNSLGIALEVLSDVDIVVERSMYWGGGLFNFGTTYNGGRITDLRAGHNVMGVNAPMQRWSFAEGTAGGPFGFQTFVLVSNPSQNVGATVTVNYLTPEGSTYSDVKLLPPGQRVTFRANDALPQSASGQVEFAIEVISDNAAVVAERAMYWGPNLQGGHAAVGVQPNSVWYFAEGIQGAPPINFDTYVLLFNPSASETIDVQVEFFGQAGLAKNVIKTLPPRSRANIYAGEYPAELAGADKAFSIRALNTLGKPFVAERAVYWRGLREGTASAGTTAAARKWGFADGQEGGFAQFQNPADPDTRPFSTYYQILNNTDTPVNVRAVFFVEPGADAAPGSGAEMTISVPARSRGTVAPSNMPTLHNRKFAAFFEAQGEVIVERAMYWGPGIVGGHASAGAVLPDSMPVLPSPNAPAAPTLTSITPTRGAQTGNNVVLISGTGLGLTASGAGATTVAFGVTPVPAANVTVVNANTLRVITPASGVGLASVLVNTRGVQLELPGAYEFFDKNAATGVPINTYRTGVGGCSGNGGPCQVMPSFLGIVRDVAARNPFSVINSCRRFGGNERFMEDVVAELRIRTGTNRWGLNWKRGLVGSLSEDIVTYFWGPEGANMRNSAQVYIIDMIGGHCGPNPSAFWQDQTYATYGFGGIGRWTTDPMCGNPRYRDATVVRNGVAEFLFPECRP